MSSCEVEKGNKMSKYILPLLFILSAQLYPIDGQCGKLQHITIWNLVTPYGNIFVWM